MTNLHDVLIEAMEELEEYQDSPQVGIFWYDKNKKELFGVNSTPSEDAQYYHSNLFNTNVKTDKRLHKNVWRKESFRNRDRRFEGNHTLVPRGRIFQFKSDGLYRICVGDWIDKYPEAINEIKMEFNLPDSSIIIKDEHWNIGRGFSQEDF